MISLYWSDIHRYDRSRCLKRCVSPSSKLNDHTGICHSVTESLVMANSRWVAGELRSPRPIADGEVVNIDLGIPGAVVLKIQQGDDVYFETYSLVRVESEQEIRAD